jgi:DNA/RNA-binding domain of Phe-tRNA-synthetase-like protein
MGHRLRVDERIWETFPDYAVLVLYAHDLRNQSSTRSSTSVLRVTEERQRAAFGEQKASSHPHIAAWRAAFGSFGAKPSRYPCSVEALLSRVLKGQELPEINQVVDLYNAVSIAHVLPVGGEDLDALTSDLVLRFADGSESFAPIGAQELVEHPEPGEVVWADSTGVTCRRWNWRQCHRTMLTTDTRNAYFILDRLAPYPLDDLQAAGDDLITLLNEYAPGCQIERELLVRG